MLGMRLVSLLTIAQRLSCIASEALQRWPSQACLPGVAAEPAQAHTPLLGGSAWYHCMTVSVLVGVSECGRAVSNFLVQLAQATGLCSPVSGRHGVAAKFTSALPVKATWRKHLWEPFGWVVHMAAMKGPHNKYVGLTLMPQKRS